MGESYLTDSQGWRLSPALIPYRNFAGSETIRPQLVTEFKGGVSDWDSRHLWRKIPKTSPAALLMTYPLSIYLPIIHCLELTSPVAGQPAKRVSLHLHLIGVEVELNFLQLFI